jgi:hypothetical protein
MKPEAKARRRSTAGPPTIYVQIPAYRDSELPKTLHQLFSKAAHPERLRVGVAWQHTPDEKLNTRYLERRNVEILDIPHDESLGCNWARSLLQKRWQNETYTLFIDSHHRFTTGWDLKTVAMYESLVKRGVRKPIVTAYLPAYTPDADPEKRMRSCLKIYYRFRTMGLLVGLTSYEITGWRWLNEPIPAHFVSLHFLFTAGDFNREIRFDPEIYFFGDEVSVSLRAFTRGYDFFHPHRILGWHEYKRQNRTPHWNDHADWRTRDAYSLTKLKATFKGRVRGTFGIGSRRSVSDYENHIGMPLFLAE